MLERRVYLCKMKRSREVFSAASGGSSWGRYSTAKGEGDHLDLSFVP